jgi:hypothetical protein
MLGYIVMPKRHQRKLFAKGFIFLTLKQPDPNGFAYAII